MKMYDLRRQSGYWHFRFGGGEDFWDTLKDLKKNGKSCLTMVKSQLQMF